jgi:histidinol-phosphatase (PHP family)
VTSGTGAGRLPPDYHVHTERCGHAAGRAVEYVEEALRRGVAGIGMSDHLPLLHKRDPQLSMDLTELEGYVAEVEDLRERYPGFVLLGIEADYLPEKRDQLEALLGSYPFDYVIGSVHYIDGWEFDDPRNQDSFTGRDLDEVYQRYLELVGDAAESGLFTILGHLDLVKKFGHRPIGDPTPWIETLADRIARAGTAVELNTAGLRKPVGEIYPSPDFLAALARRGVPLTFGSDAHRPREVGEAFAEALETANRAGYRHHLVLRAVHEDEGETGLPGCPTGAAITAELRPLPVEGSCG